MSGNENKKNSAAASTGLEIAVIGMAARFPGAKNIEECWENLVAGKESITFFTSQELIMEGISAEVVQDPHYVKAKGLLAGVENFDSAFFNYSPREARLMDPQVRLFHECAWQALEDAAYSPFSYNGLIGLYAGFTVNHTWNLLSSLQGRSASEYMEQRTLNNNYFTTLICYRLNLKGPGVTLNTACSTSLVAIHLACRGLLTGEADITMAGGVTLTTRKRGYMYQEGMIYSSDGHNRTFDARADGTVPSSGVGIVVLKRLVKALKDRDHIYAVIKGTAINNDGNRKAGYTAPGVEGQVQVIRAALRIGGVMAATVSYIETHGTATALGDPIELEALATVFKGCPAGSIRLGSIKSNVGHMDCAAGVGGVIKTILALQHRCIPPTLHFQSPNPRFNIENTPFVINDRLTPWESSALPLRAGVSSFGIGGTNAHIILEEAPPVITVNHISPGQDQVLVLSAKTSAALERMTVNLRDFLKSHPRVQPGHVAFTLQVGRACFPYRRAFVFQDIAGLGEQLTGFSPGSFADFLVQGQGELPVVFMFPGLGDQYAGMGFGLYQSEPRFREAIDLCCRLAQEVAGKDIRPYLCVQGSGAGGEENQAMQSFAIAQLTVFSYQYALSQLLISWGIKPQALVGYSFGEYSAACLAGVFSLSDAFTLMASRGQMIASLPAGAMTSVPLPASELLPFPGEAVSLAIDNGLSCVVAGTPSAIADFETAMKNRRLMCMRVPASHALHSPAMEPVLPLLAPVLQRLTFNPPHIPLVSNVTGTWYSPTIAPHNDYWLEHLRQTVKFKTGLETLSQLKGAIYIEIGPGSALSTLVAPLIDASSGQAVVNLTRFAGQKETDRFYLLRKLSRLWLHGVPIDWDSFYQGRQEKPCRVSLPLYPFEPVPYPVDESAFQDVLAEIGSPNGLGGLWGSSRRELPERFFVPSWRPTVPPQFFPGKIAGTVGIIFLDGHGLGECLASYLQGQGAEVIMVRPGEEFADHEPGGSRARFFTVHPGQGRHFEQLFNILQGEGKGLGWVVYGWGMTGAVEPASLMEPVVMWDETIIERSFQGLVSLGLVLLRQSVRSLQRFLIITDQLHDVYGRDSQYPLKAPVLAVQRVMRRQLPWMEIAAIDIERVGVEEKEARDLVWRLGAELTGDMVESVVVYRGNKRLARNVEPVRLEGFGEIGPRLKQGGVYIITNGFSGAGLLLARVVARDLGIRLVLTHGVDFPQVEDWQQWLDDHVGQEGDGIGERIRVLQQVKAGAGDFMVWFGDLSLPGAATQLFALVEERFGHIDGIFHTTVSLEGFEMSRVLETGIKSTLELYQGLAGYSLDFFLFFSPMSSVLMTGGGVTGMAELEVMAVRDFFNAFVAFQESRRCREQSMVLMSVNWDSVWGEESEGLEILNRVIHSGLSRVMVSMQDLRQQFSQERSARQSQLEVHEAAIISPRKKAEYMAPRDRVEEMVVQVWEEILGVKPVGIHDHFFELGGDSLKGMIFVNRFQELLGEIIHITIIFDAPTPAELAGYFKRHYQGGYMRLAGSGGVDVVQDEEGVLAGERVVEARQRIPVLLPVRIVGEKNGPAVFILSPPRTGSTLVRVMLAGHPGLFAPPELNLLQFVTMRERKNALQGHAASHLQGVIRAVMQLRGCSAEEAEEILQPFEERGVAIHEFYRFLQEWSRGRLLVDKSPGYSRHPGFMERAEAYFDKALYIHLMRHPYGMIQSYLEARMDLLAGEQVLEGLNLTRRQMAELTWVIDVQNILMFLRNIPAERQYVVRFEELAAEPERISRGICQFLNLEYHPGMIEPYQEKEQRMTDGIHEQGIMMGDPKFHKHKQIEPGVADHWRKNITRDFLGQDAIELSRRLGYKLIGE